MKDLPESWTVEPFSQVARYAAGRTPARANPVYWAKGADQVPWVAISDMEEYGTITETAESVSAVAYRDVFRERIVPAGTLLMSFKLTIGRVATLGVHACHNEAIISIYPREGVDQRYLGYFLSHVDYSDHQDRQIKGNTLNQSKIDSIQVVLPPAKEQARIADVLDRCRLGINIERAAETRAQQLKRAVMRELFTRGLRDEAQKDTEIGPVPESWGVSVCEDLAQDITVGVVVKPASYYVLSGVPAFRSLNVREDRIDASHLVYFSVDDNDTALSKSKLRTGDVLVVRTGYPGTSCVVPPEFDGANCIDLVIVRPNEVQVTGRFLSRFFNSEQGRSQALSNSHGLAQKHLNVGAVRQIKIPVPPTLDEQREIVTILDAIDRKIEVHRQKRQVLDELFRALLHKLMTGEIAVSNLDQSVLSLTSPPTAGPIA